MNDTTPRCAGPGSACRLLELETPGARPVWAVLDAAGMRRFTGEITLASWPVVRVFFNDGEVYYAEREGDPTIGQRLIHYGVVTPDEVATGTVQLGNVADLGRLFDRVPTLDRDAVELVLEVVTSEVLGEIADHTVDNIAIASYRHHPSGVSKWRRGAALGEPEPEVEVEPAPFSLGFDLDEVLAQVVLENDGIPLPKTDDVGEDVRAAVRQAVAEIQAATRPLPTHSLSASIFEAALDTAPETPADIVAVGSGQPHAAPVSGASATVLRRLIAGIRKS